MPAARRLVAAPSTESPDFRRDLLVETLLAVLPQGALVVGGRGLRGRLGLVGKETITVSLDSTNATDAVAVRGVAPLWTRDHAVALEGGPSVLAVTTGAGSRIAADDLAAAATAVAGEHELESIRIVQLADRDAAATKQLARAFRRLTDLPVAVVPHTGTVADTVSTIAATNLFVSHDDAAVAVARSLHTPSTSTDGHTDITELYLAIRTATSDPEAARIDDRSARALAFTLDAWARGRMSTADLHAAIADPTRVDELVGA